MDGAVTDNGSFDLADFATLVDAEVDGVTDAIVARLKVLYEGEVIEKEVREIALSSLLPAGVAGAGKGALVKGLKTEDVRWRCGHEVRFMT